MTVAYAPDRTEVAARPQRVGALPRIARPRIERWLQATAPATRLFVAPMGFGKTSVLRRVADRFAERGLYATCAPGCSLLATLAEALGHAAADLSTLDRLAGFDAVILDRLEHLDANGERLLDLLISRGDVAHLIGASTRANVVAPEHLTTGVVALCTDRQLAFDAGEIASIATELGVAITGVEALELRERTEGWPLAVGGALLTARAFGLSMTAGLEQWKADQRNVVADMVERQFESAADLRVAWNAMLEGREVSPNAARRVAALGAPLCHSDGRGWRPLRIVREMHGGVATAQRAIPVMQVRMFGSFECSLDGTAVRWLRRMDRRLVRYLLLTRDGSESKERLMETFWPGQDPAVALQSLRTTCSNVKKALSAAVGDDVGRYFTALDRVAINLEYVAVDVRRFIAHVRSGNTCVATDAAEEALYHYGQADALYTAHLGWGDEPETWLDDLARECRAMRMAAARATVGLLRGLGRGEEAAQWYMLLAERAKRHEE